MPVDGVVAVDLARFLVGQHQVGEPLMDSDRPVNYAFLKPTTATNSLR